MALHDSEPYPMSSGVSQRIKSQKSSTGPNKTNDAQDGTLNEWLLDMLSNHPSHVRRAFQRMCHQMAESLQEMGQERRFISERANSSQLAKRLREGVVHLPSVQGVSGLLFKSRHTWPIDASSLRECLDQAPELSSRLGGILSRATYGQCKGDPIDSAISRFGTHFVSQVLACLSLGTTLYEPMGSRFGSWFVERVEAHAARAVRFSLRVTEESLMGDVFLTAYLYDAGRAVVVSNMGIAERQQGMGRCSEPFLSDVVEHLHVPMGLWLMARRELPEIAMHGLLEQSGRTPTELPPRISRVLSLVKASFLAH